MLLFLSWRACFSAVDLEEPDARTAALARGQEFLYGFEASQLPREVLDAVEAAGEEMRRKAYARWAGEIFQSERSTQRSERGIRKWVGLNPSAGSVRMRIALPSAAERNVPPAAFRGMFEVDW